MMRKIAVGTTPIEFTAERASLLDLPLSTGVRLGCATRIQVAAEAALLRSSANFDRARWLATVASGMREFGTVASTMGEAGVRQAYHQLSTAIPKFPRSSTEDREPGANIFLFTIRGEDTDETTVCCGFATPDGYEGRLEPVLGLFCS